MNHGKNAELEHLVLQEDRNNRISDSVSIYVCAILCKTKEICRSIVTELS